MKFSTYSIIILFTFIFFSCEKEDEAIIGPDISFVTGATYILNDTSLNVGEQIKIKVYANKGTSNITLFQYKINKDGEITSVDSGLNTENVTYERIITKSVAETETWTFLVRDKNLKSDEVSVTLTKSGEAIYQPINYSNAITLGAQNNTSTGSFYSFSDNSIYLLNDAFNNQENIHLVYYFDELSEEDNVISSPGANIDASVFPQEAIGLMNWTTRFTTRFIKMTDLISVEEFNACENDSLILAHTFEFSAGKRKCKNLIANDIYAFVTEDQKEGLIKINQVTGTKEGTVEFEIKWRE